MQPGFALCRAALIEENIPLTAEDAIRNQLLEGWVLLHFAARSIAGMLRIQNHIQVAVDIRREPLKMAGLMEDGGGDDQNVFNGRIHSDCRSQKRSLKPTESCRSGRAMTAGTTG